MMTDSQKAAIKQLQELEKEEKALARKIYNTQLAIEKPYEHMIHEVVEVTYQTADKVEMKELAIWGGYDIIHAKSITPRFYKVGRGGRIAYNGQHLTHLERLEENGGKIISMELHTSKTKK